MDAALGDILTIAASLIVVAIIAAFTWKVVGVSTERLGARLDWATIAAATAAGY